MSHRLFIGIRPPAEIRSGLLAIMQGIENARWQRDDQLHLTLAFVGEVESPVADDLARSLDTARGSSFDVVIAGVGHFEKRGRAKAVWARVVPDEALDRLHRKVQRICEQTGCGIAHRRFIPHITLARLNASSGPVAPFLAAQDNLRLPPFRVDRFCLFESQLGRSGSRYEIVAEYALD